MASGSGPGAMAWPHMGGPGPSSSSASGSSSSGGGGKGKRAMSNGNGYAGAGSSSSSSSSSGPGSLNARGGSGSASAGAAAAAAAAAIPLQGAPPPNPLRKPKKGISASGKEVYRGSRWAQSPSAATMKQYDDTMVTIRKWLAAERPDLSHAFDTIDETTLDAMVAYLDHAIDRGLSYNTLSRANSSLVAFFRFRLGRKRDEWEAIADPAERWRSGNPCFSARYRAKYHSVSRIDLKQKNQTGAPTGTTRPILYPHVSAMLEHIEDKLKREVSKCLTLSFPEKQLTEC